ncbi:MAG TPA: DUF2490 domain-containing protein [Cyclobacteriaceae bacterium]
MTKTKVIITFVLICNFSMAGLAQKNIASQNNGWYMYFGNHKLTNKISLHTEYQWRRNEVIKHWQQSLFRIGVDYISSPAVMITGGYGYIVNFPYGDQPIAFKFHEHRIWEQMVLTQSSGRFFFNHRFRLEQRYLENRFDNGNGSSTSNGYTYRNRARYRFLVNIPFNKRSMEKGALFASIYDEVFLQFGPNFGRNYLDQNRLFGAVGYLFSSNANFQIGYLNHFVIKSNGLDAENNHTLQLSLTYNFDFRKKEQR